MSVLRTAGSGIMTYSSSLLGVKWLGFKNAILRGHKLGYVAVLLLVLLVAWGEYVGTMRALEYVCDAGRTLFDFNRRCTLVGTSIASRVLENGLLVLGAGVTFSAITTAITTLYTSDDLNFLLAQPLPSARVFAIKLFDTYISAAGVPSLLLVAPLIALGIFFQAAWWYFFLALLAAFITFALPVGLGASIAIVLMRLSPAGRVREVATGLGVALSALLVYLIRAARPEEFLRRLNDQTEGDTAINQLIEQFGNASNPLLPSSWASEFIWSSARGDFNNGILLLSLVAAMLMLVAHWLATRAYLEGWVRGLESSRVRLDSTKRKASWFERSLGLMGATGHLITKDARLLFRDATQWSQLLILMALGGVYVVSVQAVPGLDNANQQQVILYRNALGFLTIAFQGFVIAGVGVRMAFPSVSLEGYGYWLLRTAPLSSRQIVVAKFWGALPPTLLLAFGLGFFSALSLQLSEIVTLMSVVVAVSSAFVMTGLGVGIGAAVPRFKFDNPAEVAVSAGGLIYMGCSIVFGAITTVIAARPVYMGFSDPRYAQGLSYFSSSEGVLVLGIMLMLTILGTLLPLWYGWTRLDRHE
ncbi:MAG: putative ABC transporter permease subunit [Deinococcales bacterium]